MDASDLIRALPNNLRGAGRPHMGDGEPAPATADRDLIERHVARVIVKPQVLEVCLIPTCNAENHGLDDLAPCHPPIPTITIPWTAPSFAAVKGIVHAPYTEPAMKPESRDALLAAITYRKFCARGTTSLASPQPDFGKVAFDRCDAYFQA